MVFIEILITFFLKRINSMRDILPRLETAHHQKPATPMFNHHIQVASSSQLNHLTILQVDGLACIHYPSRRHSGPSSG